MTRNSLRFLPLAALLAIALSACSKPQVAIRPSGGDAAAIATVKVEIADTPAKREIGLMYRKRLAPDAGMIFIFPKALPVRFWMKNTEIPLDMIFANGEGRIIGIVTNAAPYSERLLAVEGNSKYVLEVNAGFCKRFGVKAGDYLEFRGFKPRAAN